MLKQAVFTALAAAAVSTSALVVPAMLTPAAAQGINFLIGTPPPAPVYEMVPAPRAGYVWAPGYYRWDGGRHVWSPARWIAERVGYRWVPDRWDHGPSGWYYTAGRWDRNSNGIPDRYEHRADNRSGWGDRDHDGIPNRYDNRDNRGWDRDRDGVPNRYDGHPDNPYRR